ncbi:hypothetical protein VIGAN_01496100 [Vigna angularis var. angularis]|uniref:Uncharacterized protein n=1 Tax=Vigna angularis var. angularis TaxID=157739 RepID=A0A0S3R8Z2_PHAAN|nr:hypothetical protein VIGAN_01496100 [Vigna angularis var. angularis]
MKESENGAVRESLRERESGDERLEMGEASEEVRRFSELEVLVLKRRCTGASYKRVVPLTVSGRCSSSFEDTIGGEGVIVGGKGAKPDVGRDRVLRHLILTEIRSKVKEREKHAYGERVADVMMPCFGAGYAMEARKGSGGKEEVDGGGDRAIDFVFRRELRGGKMNGMVSKCFDVEATFWVRLQIQLLRYL